MVTIDKSRRLIMLGLHDTWAEMTGTPVPNEEAIMQIHDLDTHEGFLKAKSALFNEAGQPVFDENGKILNFTDQVYLEETPDSAIDITKEDIVSWLNEDATLKDRSAKEIKQSYEGLMSKVMNKDIKFDL